MSTSQLLDKLLNNIEEEASTVDPWETASSRSTIRGIGSWSGKGIMAVGRSLINGVNYVNERVALARIASAQSTLQQKVGWRIGQHAPLVEKAYQDMLEYQRCANVAPMMSVGLTLSDRRRKDQVYILGQ